MERIRKISEAVRVAIVVKRQSCPNGLSPFLFLVQWYKKRSSKAGQSQPLRYRLEVLSLIFLEETELELDGNVVGQNASTLFRVAGAIVNLPFEGIMV